MGKNIDFKTLHNRLRRKSMVRGGEINDSISYTLDINII